MYNEMAENCLQSLGQFVKDTNMKLKDTNKDADIAAEIHFMRLTKLAKK
jgi:cytochrome c2